jgi:hypothetical protein
VTTTGPASILVNPAPLGNPVLNTPKELDVLQTSVAQSMMVDGTLVIVPALDGSTTPPAPAPTPTPTPTAVCPNGTYAGIATGVASETASVPAGTVYRVEPSTACITAVAQTIVDVSSGNLDILETGATQLIPVTLGGGRTDNVIITTAAPAAAPEPVIAVQAISITINGKFMTCKPTSGAPGTMTCPTP